MSHTEENKCRKVILNEQLTVPVMKSPDLTSPFSPEVMVGLFLLLMLILLANIFSGDKRRGYLNVDLPPVISNRSWELVLENSKQEARGSH